MSDKKTANGIYGEFFNQVVALARARGYTGLTVQVEWGNNPTQRLGWTPAIEEQLNVIEVRKA